MYLVILNNKRERNPRETTKNGQSRYTGNNRHTRHMAKITKNTDEQLGPFGELMC